MPKKISLFVGKQLLCIRFIQDSKFKNKCHMKEAVTEMIKWTLRSVSSFRYTDFI